MIEIRDTLRPRCARYRAEAKCASLKSAVMLAGELSRILDRPMTIWVDGVQCGGPIDERPSRAAVEEPTKQRPQGQLELFGKGRAA